MGVQGPFRLSVDRSKCEGHGMCEQVAPNLIRLNEDAEPVFDQGDLSSADRPMADAAVHCCPVAALSIYEVEKGEPVRDDAPLAHR